MEIFWWFFKVNHDTVQYGKLNKIEKKIQIVFRLTESITKNHWDKIYKTHNFEFLLNYYVYLYFLKKQNDQSDASEVSIHTNHNDSGACTVSSRPFLEYYFILLFLLCFATPVLITTSLNVFIQSAVRNTTYEVNVS